jgi:hypothetical protein
MVLRSLSPARVGAISWDLARSSRASRHPLRIAWLARTVPVALAAAAAMVFAAVSVYRHDRFASRGFDLEIFDQTIWATAASRSFTTRSRERQIF